MRKILVTAVALAIILAAPRAGFAQTRPTLSPEELHIYNQARTVIDWTPEEIRDQKELEGLRPAESQDDLPLILQQVGERVLAFINNFRNATATETLKWEADGPSSHSESTAAFRYIVVMKTTGPWPKLVEYRTDPQGHEINLGEVKVGPFLTSGFALALLYFYPDNQDSCLYRYFGRQKVDDQETDVVGFAEIPEQNLGLATLDNGAQKILLLLQGLAWIDAQSHEILRLQTNLVSPPLHTHLVKESTLIEYARMHFPETTSAFFLPKKVEVDVWQSTLAWTTGVATSTARGNYPGAASGEAKTHFRNIYTYSDYKLFRVESHILTAPP